MEGGFFPEEAPAASTRSEDDSVALPTDTMDACMHCGGIPVSQEMRGCLGLLVCDRCSRSRVRLITKTNCRERYLLTEEEILQFRCLTRPNPHRGSWNDMQLYLEDEISKFSIQKHGSLEEVERIKGERSEQLKRRRMGKIKKQVKSLKQKVFLKPRKEFHRHTFRRVGPRGVCECGMEVELEEI